MLISIIIPAYNEERTLERVVKLVLKHLSYFNFEVIIIDDCSVDKTGLIGRELQKNNKNVKYFRHNHNEGKTGAIKTGFSKSKGDILIIQDADLEYHPKFIKRVINPILNDKADVSFGSRFKGEIKGMRSLHLFGNWFLSKATFLLLKFPTSDMETGYKAFTRSVAENLNITGKAFELEPQISIQLSKMDIRFKEVPIDYDARIYGVKHISWKDGLKAFTILLKGYVNNL